jgi:hypothetical protein
VWVPDPADTLAARNRAIERAEHIRAAHSECADLAGTLGLDRVRSRVLEQSVAPDECGNGEGCAGPSWSEFVASASLQPTHDYVTWETKQQLTNFGRRPTFRPVERSRLPLWYWEPSDFWYDASGTRYRPQDKPPPDMCMFLGRTGEAVVPWRQPLSPDIEGRDTHPTYVLPQARFTVGPVSATIHWGELREFLSRHARTGTAS